MGLAFTERGKKFILAFIFFSYFSIYSHSQKTKQSTLKSIPDHKTIISEIDKLVDQIVAIRRTLHKIPEVAFTEVKTSNTIKQVLQDNNISYTEGWGVNNYGPNKGGTGVVAQIGTGHPPCVGLRADIDALQITENVESDFKSEHPGFMHACGHDVHTSMLLGAALLLKKYESQIEGTVRLIFQPAEENDAGAIILVEEGVLTHYPPVQQIFGLHIDPKIPTGAIISYPGLFWGGVSGFIVTFYGKGGHSAKHHLTVDPIVAGMQFIRGLFDIQSRELFFSPEHAGAISVTHISTENNKATNIIPNSMTIGGSLRSIESQTMYKIRQRIVEMAENTAKAYHCTVYFEPEQRDIYVPSLFNDPQLFKFYEKVVSEIARDNKLIETEPEFTSEDFAFYAEKVPSVFSLIGIGSGSELPDHHPTNYSLHNSKLFVDERVLPVGAAIHSHLAFQSIVDLNGKNMEGEFVNAFDEL